MKMKTSKRPGYGGAFFTSQELIEVYDLFEVGYSNSTRGAKLSKY